MASSVAGGGDREGGDELVGVLRLAHRDAKHVLQARLVGEVAQQDAPLRQPAMEVGRVATPHATEQEVALRGQRLEDSLVAEKAG